MLSPSDIKHRKLLLVFPNGNTENLLRLQTGNLLYQTDEKTVDKLPLYSLLAVFLCGRFSITSQLIKGLSEHAVGIFLMNPNFAAYAHIAPPLNGNYLLRQSQYLMTNEQNLALAKQLIVYKITNQNRALSFFGKQTVSQADISSARDNQELLGIEGSASASYFSELFSSLSWHRRLPQVKPDPINLLMDVGYTMLFNLTDAMLALFGFDQYKGFYHTLFFARKSLVCDLMEPVRPLIDAAILTMYRRNIFVNKDFAISAAGVRFAGGYKTHVKYAACFTKTLATHKEQLFRYVRQFYFTVSRPQNYEFKNCVLDFSLLPQSL